MLTVGDVYSYYIRDMNQYGACQILEISKDGICHVPLDILKDSPLNQDDLKDIQPLSRNGDKNFFQYYASFNTIPSSYIYVGHADPVLVQFREASTNNWPIGREHMLLRKWREIPEEVMEAREKHRFDRTPVVIGSKTYNKNRRYIDDEMLAEIKDYAELDALPCLDSVHINQYDEELFTYLQKRHLITYLSLNNNNLSTLDLRKTFFSEVGLDISCIRELYLNDQTTKLMLHGKVEPDIKIHAKNNGAGIYMIYSLKNNPVSNLGLREIENIALLDFHELDANCIAEEFPKLRKIHLVGSPGSVMNLGHLSKIKSLEEINLFDIFGFNSDDLDPLLTLEHLNLFWMEGVPEDAGKYARKTFKDKVYSLKITKLRKPEWIIENANNPFRAWDGDEGVPSGAFKKASLFYKDLKKEILEASDRASVLLAVKNYTEAINQLDKRYKNFIETTQAEDIFQAADKLFDEILAGKEIVSIDDLHQVMEETRTW